jgi:hypothetical protein
MRPTALLALLAVLLALVPCARAAGWRRPVPGPVARAFAYGPEPFLRGWHRGVDLAAPPGTPVHAACTGTVVTARGAGPAGGVVTVRCGRWRVTHLPLASVAVHRGQPVTAGAAVGVLAASSAHAGLHLGVRLAADRLGYVDPMRFLPTGTTHRIPPVTVAAGRDPDLGPAPAPAVSAAPTVSAAHAASAAPAVSAGAPAVSAAPATSSSVPARAVSPGAPAVSAARAVSVAPAVSAGAPASAVSAGAAARVRALAPWPAWLGLALLLAGAAGGGVRLGRRRMRGGAAAAVREGVA